MGGDSCGEGAASGATNVGAADGRDGVNVAQGVLLASRDRPRPPSRRVVSSCGRSAGVGAGGTAFHDDEKNDDVLDGVGALSRTIGVSLAALEPCTGSTGVGGVVGDSDETLDEQLARRSAGRSKAIAQRADDQG